MTKLPLSKILTLSFLTFSSLCFSETEQEPKITEIVEQELKVAELESKTIESKIAHQEPRIKAKFYSTFATGLIPRLQDLRQSDPECNKIVFKLENYPTNQPIIFDVKRTIDVSPELKKDSITTSTTEYTPLMTFTLLEDGSILPIDSKESLKYIVSSSRGFLPGERVFYRFRTQDQSIDKQVSGIPNPMTFKDEEGKVAMSAELVTTTPTVYLINFPTMTEGEEFELKSTSVGETTKAKTKFSADTPIHYTPSVRGKSKGGLGVLEVKRKNGDIYILRLPWGKAMNGPVIVQRAYPSH